MYDDEIALAAFIEKEKHKPKIEDLEGEISGIMEILGGYVDGINILNAKILMLEERLDIQESINS